MSQTSIDLIPAGLSHAEVIAGMHRICFTDFWSPQAVQEILSMPGTHGLIAYGGKALEPAPGPAGFVLWRSIAGESEILSIAVLPPWRRHGIGGVLLDAAMAAARQSGAIEMFLEVSDKNNGAQALYCCHGFSGIGLRKGYYNGNDAITMRCPL